MSPDQETRIIQGVWASRNRPRSACASCPMRYVEKATYVPYGERHVPLPQATVCAVLDDGLPAEECPGFVEHVACGLEMEGA